MSKWIMVGAILAAIGVELGAFGAHGLADQLTETGRLGTYEKAVQYQMYHSLALVMLGLIGVQYRSKLIDYAGILFMVGIFLFSGSLYLLAIFNISWMGAIAPIGGSAFIVGWVLMAVMAGRYSKEQ
ncbi:DUF423 domain-containing protein [Anaerolineales bacterium]